jgi:hypothetical protein
MAVKTAKVAGRRRLRFENYDQVLDDVRHLAGVPCRQLGNWSLGQVCEHLAKTMDMSLDGVDGRAVGPLVKKRILTRPMSPGFKVPRVIAVLLPAEGDAAIGLAAMQTAVARLQQTKVRAPHPLFGKMSADEWDQLHMRHSEMHLSFIVPQ